ncbi:heat-inducible transcriptional repressor HrcA [Paenibacillus mucilaginosus]|uniref:Heat-inducible transcription repressor HrcA n=3 Tax=Paenibacillus mucilaginosus TaxID=61624 RepID=H6NIH6_9BACL|nr:heat-inducible transcriptional repressor HrcA [Paenibacillus mucilaginosus]AEI42684.1 HrcA [Paenibacillus mucilaginosus KNP414]AFC32287.1 HrcA [Paenibacillus mucilaginosus 3016]AFH64592.1 HrcA family transcriptional regulator [Paenibacillus mucilaginosus K02]MCG7217068.1 heat-inducible transcriptional repressor HrcA [Paenibacillus mucilaginosus]WDM26071.1 heat-inducible transcriptional repressor HrcA [Paenibacillus mucilaginosus]
MLTERQRQILSAIVDDYIRSAEPVGSRSISKRGNVGFSPATIRNEMSDLEEMGFLEQPHTSAGRIPSHKGYRYYVDHLMTYAANQEFQEVDLIKRFFADKMQEMERIIQQVAMILSNLTSYTSIVMGPEMLSTTMKHLQIVPLNERTAVAIIVTNTGQVENKTVTIPEGIPMSEIEKFVNILNARLQNVPLLHFKSKLYSEIAAEMSSYVSGYEELLGMIDVVTNRDEDERIFLGGTTNMLTQPEFKDVDKVKSILDLLGEAPRIIQLFEGAAGAGGIQVRIGSENKMEAVNDCSLITASYSIDGQLLGTIGILGPTRMDYARVIQLLDYLSKDMTKLMGRWYK